MGNPEIKIFDIMACNVYWDFDKSPMPKETHKLLVALWPTPGVVAPDYIEKITGYGPNGYEHRIAAHDKFDNVKKNGWLYTPALQNYWYMYNIPSGFMKEGEYTIEIACKDGSVVKKSRVQKSGPSDAAVEAYLKNRDKVLESYSPSKTKPLAAGSSRKGIDLKWSPLKEFGGPDEFYVTRLAEASTPMEFDGNNLTLFDNIYVQRLRSGDTTVGRNRGKVTVEEELKPNTNYGYFVEITDANVGGEANICIFQPHQFFKTP